MAFWSVRNEIAPRPSRKRRHPPKKALGRPADEPDRVCAFDPVSDAVPVRPLGALTSLRNAFGRAGGERGCRHRPADIPRSADSWAGRWSLPGPSSPGRNHPAFLPASSPEPTARSKRARADGASEVGQSPARHSCRPRATFLRMQSRRSPPMYRPPMPGNWRSSAADLGKPPRRATAWAQAMRLRARA